MLLPRSAVSGTLAVLLALFLARTACRAREAPAAPAAGADVQAPAAADPAALIAAEIERWSALLRSKAADPAWAKARQNNEPALAEAAADLTQGRRLLALERLARIQRNLATFAYLQQRPPRQRQEMAAFEAEWKRMGQVLRADLAAPSPAALEGVRPAAARALGEVALPQVRLLYEASLEYGRSTEPMSGLFYLGEAQSQHELAAFLRTLKADGPAAPTPPTAPALRDLGPELDALETELLAAYRPPASIERHGEFINLSAAHKEAVELNAAGLRYGALLRYLQAKQRLAALRPASPVAGGGDDGSDLARYLARFEQRFAGGDVDHSIGQLFLEQARDALEADPAAAQTSAALAATIAAGVLPSYLLALEPVPPAPPKPEPRVTVTLVRWPYT
jgi:hypothetical protein